MDDKAKIILSRYKQKIEGFRFDEFDILGFLIFIRQYISRKKYPSVIEFCDLIAHRKRNQGRAMRSIKAVSQNNFETDTSSGKVIGSEGIPDEQWSKEWKDIFTRFEIHFTQKRLREIRLCIISLAQKTEFHNEEGTGRFEIIIDHENNIDLCYCLDNPYSLYVTFLRGGQWQLAKDCPRAKLDLPVMTVRENGKLRLKYGDKYLM